MHEYCYVIVENEPDTMKANIIGCGNAMVDVDKINMSNEALSTLLQDGWRPMRETAMGSTKVSACVLLLLERER